MPRNMSKITLDKPVKEIAAAIKAGSEKDFRLYFDSRFGRLYNYAFSLASDPEIAEDLVQNAFLKLWRSREKISEDKSIDALMMISIRNRVSLRGSTALPSMRASTSFASRRT